MNPPLTAAEIPDLIKKIEELIVGWQSTFVVAKVNLSAQADGSVKVQITLN